MSTQILVIDDDQLFNQLLFRGLGANYQVVQAFDGFSAMDLIDQQLPDLILLDVLMPGATGFSLLYELISYPDTKNIPIIIISNTADSLSLTNLRHLGVVAIYDKSRLLMTD